MRACVRACVCMCVRAFVCNTHIYAHTLSHTHTLKAHTQYIVVVLCRVSRFSRMQGCLHSYAPWILVPAVVCLGSFCYCST